MRLSNKTVNSFLSEPSIFPGQKGRAEALLKNRFRFICPLCRKELIMDATPVIHLHSPLYFLVRCACGYYRNILYETHETLGQVMHIKGKYFSETLREYKPMDIFHLNPDGFLMKPDEQDNLKPGDTILVFFRLKDKDKNKIARKAVVKKVLSSCVQAQFEQKGDEFAQEGMEKVHDRAIADFTFKTYINQKPLQAEQALS